jgi:hypothetical protein
MWDQIEINPVGSIWTKVKGIVSNRDALPVRLGEPVPRLTIR